MNVWRYQTSQQLEIDAPIEQVYATLLPVLTSFHRMRLEIARIEVEKRLSEQTVPARSYLKVAGPTLAYLYRLTGRPTHYKGVGTRGRFLRGYFQPYFQTERESHGGVAQWKES